MENLGMLVIIILVSFSYVLFSLLLRHKLTDIKQMKVIQNKMKLHNKELQDAMKKQDTVRMKRLETEQAKMMPEMMKSMFAQFKPMLIIFPTFIFLFGFVKNTFSFYYLNLGFGIPFLHEPVVWIGPDIFMALVLILGIVLSIVVNKFIDKDIKNEVK